MKVKEERHYSDCGCVKFVKAGKATVRWLKRGRERGKIRIEKPENKKEKKKENRLLSILGEVYFRQDNEVIFICTSTIVVFPSHRIHVQRPVENRIK